MFLQLWDQLGRGTRRQWTPGYVGSVRDTADSASGLVESDTSPQLVIPRAANASCLHKGTIMDNVSSPYCAMDVTGRICVEVIGDRFGEATGGFWTEFQQRGRDRWTVQTQLQTLNGPSQPKGLYHRIIRAYQINHTRRILLLRHPRHPRAQTSGSGRCRWPVSSRAACRVPCGIQGMGCAPRVWSRPLIGSEVLRPGRLENKNANVQKILTAPSKPER